MSKMIPGLDYDEEDDINAPPKKIVRRRYTEKEILFIENNLGILPIREIARHIGRNYKAVEGFIQRSKIPRLHPSSEMSKKYDREAVKDAINKGYTFKDIIGLIGISEPYLRYFVKHYLGLEYHNKIITNSSSERNQKD